MGSRSRDQLVAAGGAGGGRRDGLINGRAATGVRAAADVAGGRRERAPRRPIAGRATCAFVRARALSRSSPRATLSTSSPLALRPLAPRRERRYQELNDL
jgi:hypothetical protein